MTTPVTISIRAASAAENLASGHAPFGIHSRRAGGKQLPLGQVQLASLVRDAQGPLTPGRITADTQRTSAGGHSYPPTIPCPMSSSPSSAVPLPPAKMVTQPTTDSLGATLFRRPDEPLLPAVIRPISSNRALGAVLSSMPPATGDSISIRLTPGAAA